MPKKLNSFILSDEVIEEMKSKMKEGFIREIELGFSLCRSQDSNILKVGEQCTGGECSVSLPSTCEGDDIYAGAYHTHPHESSRPSSQDIPVIYKRGLACIGGIKEVNLLKQINTIQDDKEEIKCYVRSVPKDIEAMYIFKDKLTFIRDRMERRKEIDKFVNDNFRTIDII